MEIIKIIIIINLSLFTNKSFRAYAIVTLNNYYLGFFSSY